MYGLDILCGISKVTFEIPHKISYPYIERSVFYLDVKIEELLDLRAHAHFWDLPLISVCGTCSHLIHPVKTSRSDQVFQI